MQPFDCLSLDAPLFGLRLLEASAGTGKTFAIEHIFTRLLLEAPDNSEPLRIEEILAITFTRAAARELRLRIRTNLQKALAGLAIESAWPYLKPHAGSALAERRLRDALIGFDRAQIFTIHGFCHRMLCEYALEAKAPLNEGREGLFRETIRPYLLDFLERQTILSPEQIGLLMARQGGSIETLADQLLKMPVPLQGGDFADDEREFRSAWSERPVTDNLHAEFESIRSSYKSEIKGRFEEQIDAWIQQDLRRLIGEKGTLFHFLASSNRKMRAKETRVPADFEWARERLLPIIERAADPLLLLNRLRFAWQPPLEKILEEKGIFTPDFLLERMNRALAEPLFLKRVQETYRAAIIDEFQDTDALQWRIFQTLFLDPATSRRALYLVGDPKQSIYRFRNADLYTYFAAKHSLGSDSLFSLDTNFRSTPALLSALNDLFSDEQMERWLILPREKRSEPYQPVKAGLKESWDPGDGKGALHFFAVDNLKDSAFAFMADEIVRLSEHVNGFQSFAVLVKDRYQARDLARHLRERNIPVQLRGQTPLSETFAFRALEELFDALFFPRDASRLKIFLAGPFAEWSPQRICDEDPSYEPLLFKWKHHLEKGGLSSFFSHFWNEPMMAERTLRRGGSFHRDVSQLMEGLLQIRIPTYEAIKRFFREMEQSDPEEDVSARRGIEHDEQAVHVITMHVSKGLEFDIVFALGAATSTPSSQEPEEAEAENLRQLYVALTRAKKRLYIPLLPMEDDASSPLDLFWKRSKQAHASHDIVSHLTRLNRAITFEKAGAYHDRPETWNLERAKAPGFDDRNSPHISNMGRVTIVESRELSRGSKSKFVADRGISETLKAKCATNEMEWQKPFAVLIPKLARNLYSYSSLTRFDESKASLETFIASEEKTIHTLPRGAETGVVIHRIFERFFSEPQALDAIIAEEIRLASLQEWELSIREMFLQTMELPFIDGRTLVDLKREERRAEVEFLFCQAPHYIKGFIDLVVIVGNELTFFDWKTNWLGTGDEHYAAPELHKAMEPYWLQASLYAEALSRSFPECRIKEAIYLFLRGIGSPSQGLIRFQPKPLPGEMLSWKE